MLRIETSLTKTVLIIQSWKGFNLLLMLYRSFPISKVGMDGLTSRRNRSQPERKQIGAGGSGGIQAFCLICSFEVADVSVFGTVWRTSNVFRSVRFARSPASEAFNRVFAPS
jgi:hypothetical protein